MPDDELYHISTGMQPSGAPINGAGIPIAPTGREETLDLYKNLEASSGSNLLPLILAAYPSNDANSLLLVTSPGAGAHVNTKDTSTLEITLPGGDILVEFSADIDWSLPSAVYNQTASSGGSQTSTATSIAHTHGVSGSTDSSNGSINVPTGTHIHDMFYTDGNGTGAGTITKYVESGPGAKGWEAYRGGEGTFQTTSTSTITAVAPASHGHPVTGLAAASGGGSHTHDIVSHSHTVPPTTAKIDVKAELIIDTVVIAAGLSQFHVEGFTGKEGVIQLRSLYILQRTTGTSDVLSAGQHTAGLRFTISTTDFSAVSTVTAENIALILRDAGFDPAVKVFVP